MSHLGNMYVPCEGPLPKDVFLSSTSDPGKLFVKVVNTGRTHHELELSVPGAYSCSCEGISGDHDDRNNLEAVGLPVNKVRPVRSELPVHEGRAVLEVPPMSVQVLVIDILSE